MAVHPDYPQNGYFFVKYTSQGGAGAPGNFGDIVIERYTRSAANPNVADLASAIDEALDPDRPQGQAVLLAAGYRVQALVGKVRSNPPVNSDACGRAAMHLVRRARAGYRAR